MAVTKIHPIKSTLKKALDYIENPDKTDNKLLVSSFACSYETADTGCKTPKSNSEHAFQIPEISNLSSEFSGEMKYLFGRPPKAPSPIKEYARTEIKFFPDFTSLAGIL